MNKKEHKNILLKRLRLSFDALEPIMASCEGQPMIFYEKIYFYQDVYGLLKELGLLFLVLMPFRKPLASFVPQHQFAKLSMEDHQTAVLTDLQIATLREDLEFAIQEVYE